jgi:acetyl esterase/lipase
MYVCGCGILGAVTVDDFVARWYTNAQGVLPYRLFIPTNYNAGTRYPLTLFLHGSGERGSDNRLQLKNDGCLVFASETNQLRHPSFMVAPQCPSDSYWEAPTLEALVLGMMNSLMGEFSIDTNRLYITGLSMGGYGTWDYIGQYPNMFAAAIPMSGGGTTELAPRMTQIAIWNFHSASDGTVPVSESRTMVEAVRRAGGNPIYTEYVVGGHGIWTTAYNTPILMDWVYAQQRGTNASALPLLSVNMPTDRPIYAATGTNLDLSGAASFGNTPSWVPNSVVWTNYGQSISHGVATGTTNWAITNVVLNSAVTNFILVLGRETSWYTPWAGITTFNDTLAVIFPPFISLQPESRAVNEGDAVTFTVAVNPAAPLPRYQWRLNGINVAGATAVSLALTNVDVRDAGAYSVCISNQFGAVTSSDALLTVNRPPVADAGLNQTIECAGGQTPVLLDGSKSADPDGDALTCLWTEGATPLGTQVIQSAVFTCGLHTLTLKVTDPSGASSTATVIVAIVDTTPPVLTCPTNVTAEFWDEHGAAVAYLVTATDGCQGPVVPTCFPPAGSLFPIGTTTVSCSATDSAGNLAACVFPVTVLGARGVKSNVLAQLVILRGTASNRVDCGELDDMIDALGLDTAEAPRWVQQAHRAPYCWRHHRHPRAPLWVDETHLDRRNGDWVFLHEKDAVNELVEILEHKRSQIPDAVAQNLIERLVRADRLLAVVCIQDAARAGVNPKKLAEALEEVAKGDQAAAKDRPDQAIQHYQDAWEHAVHLRINGVIDPASKRMQLEFLGVGKHVYAIEASSNLVDWVKVGTCTADAEGKVKYTDPDASHHPARFYRVVRQ